MRKREPSFLVVVAFASFGTRDLLAEPRRDNPRMVYRADENCPSSEAFVGLLGREGAKVELAAETETEPDLVVTLSTGPDGSHGRLEVRGARGAGAVREVSGGPCGSVAAALALVTSLALEGDRPAPQPRATAPVPPPAEPRVVRAPRRRDEPSWQWGPGLAGGIVTGPLEGMATHATLLVDLAVASPMLSLRGYGTHVFERTSSYEWGSAATGLTVGGLQLCPLGVSSFRVRLRACAAGELGVLSAEGQLSAVGGVARTDRAFFAAVVGAARVEWLLGRTWQAEIQGGVSIPLTKYEYTLLAPATKVGAVPDVGAGAALGLIARIP